MADPISPADVQTHLLPRDIFEAFEPRPETDAERMRRIASQVCMEDRALCREAARNKAASLEDLIRGQNFVHFSIPYPLEGIFYTLDHLPPSLAAVKEAAEAVFPIVHKRDGEEETDHGSMVCLSAEGDFATIPHVLYDISDHIATRVGDKNYFLSAFGRNLYLRADGQLIPLKEEQIAQGLEQVPFSVVHYQTKKRSMALITGIPLDQPELPLTLKLPLGVRAPFVRVAKRGPEVGEQVFAISFPNTHYGDEVNRIHSRFRNIHGDGIKRISWGRVIRITDEGEIITTAKTAPGSSGGALVNSEGELVGLIAGTYKKESIATLATQLFLNRADN